MVIDFAKINVKEQPVLILQNLDDTPIGVLKYAFNVEADLCYNEISTLTFDLPAYVDRKLTENYGRVVGMRIIDIGVTYYPQINEFQGKRSLQIVIQNYCRVSLN